MAHFAKLNDDKIVESVFVVANRDITDESGSESEALGIAFCRQHIAPGDYVQTSYNGNFRGRYAAVGDLYDEALDEFVDPPEEA